MMDKISHDDIHALVDGRLSPDRQDRLRVLLADDAEAGATASAWQAQREALRALQRPLLDEAVPEALLVAVRRGESGRRRLDDWWRWGGMAAAVLLAFGIGWLSHGQFDGRGARQVAGAQSFVRQASLAHAVFSPEVRHPVEVTAAQQEHLVQWLSKRLGRPLKVPLLHAEGYELVGGRLLPGDGGARAQFMFQNATGVRLTLYLGAVDAPAPDGKTPGAETAFRYSGDGPVPSFYWVDQGFGYALSGAVTKDELLKIAGSVNAQL